MTQHVFPALDTNNIFTGIETAPNVSNIIMMDGTTYAFTNAGITAAIAACPSGGAVLLPPATYVITGTISITNKPVSLLGMGWGANLQVASSVGSSTDIILVQPSANDVLNGISFANFKITVASGTPGRYGIHFDGTNGDIYNVLVDHVSISAGLGSYAVYSDGSGGGQGIPALSTIQNCVLFQGVKMTNAGDTVRILNNQLNSGSTTNADLDIAFQSGAADLLFKGNSCVGYGGIHIGANGTTIQIIENEMEPLAGGTGSHGAAVDIDGVCTDPIIARNSIQVVNGTPLVGLRINSATNAQIFGNHFGRGSDTAAIATTAASVTSNVATLTMATNPVTGKFVAGGRATVSGFTGGDTYFNGTFVLLTVTATQITYSLTHANASAGTNGSVVAIGTDILITSSATDTQIGTNSWNTGAPVSSMISDSGTRTVIAAGYNGGFLLGNGQPINFLTATGTVTPFAKIQSTGEIDIYGQGSSATAQIEMPLGATYIRDGGASPNYGLAITSGSSTVPSASTVVSVGNLSSSAANPASAGTIRLASGDTIRWRNNANGADLTISKNGSDVFSLPALFLAAPPAIGGTTPGSAAYTTISATSQITSTVSTGTAPLVIASTTNVANLNASTLSGATFAAPGAIGGTTPGSGAFTTITTTGLATNYNGIVTAGNGVASVYGSTSQRSETAADANVLTYTPPAAVGSYRIRFVMSISAANTATLGWTATWTDSNGNAQTPTNLSLVQSGTAAPALTFATSAAGNYYGEAFVDTNNAATAIVVKLTFSGTSFTAKVSATIERLI